MKNYRAVGIMSGTSLDGLDIVLCNFTYNNVWSFQIEKSLTIKYSKDWQTKLSSAPSLSGYELTLLDKEYGRFIGNSVKDFLTNCTSPIDVIASHGHTVFHQPNKKLTLQIGNGQEIAIATGIKTICNFRSLDVALGGQGAPLVPVGDQFLFPEYDFCMNIGGFANISFDDKGKRVAYDIGPANIVLNYLANKLGHPIDKNGALGFLGKSDDQLLNELNSLSYYSLNRPKSLGKEWLEQIFIPVLNQYNINIHNQLKTVYEHIAFQISKAIESKKTSKTLLTGGGAYNKLLINLIKQKTKSEIIIPDKEIIEYKEALIFALLGILKLTSQVNCLASVTGASKDSSTGLIYNP